MLRTVPLTLRTRQQDGVEPVRTLCSAAMRTPSRHVVALTLLLSAALPVALAVAVALVPFREAMINANVALALMVAVAAAARWSRVTRGGFELPSDGAELQVLSRGQPVGRFVLVPKPGTGFSLDQRVVAVALADQVGAVLATPQVGYDGRYRSYG